MPIHRIYVRGHGHEDKQPLVSRAEIPLKLVTLGHSAGALSDEVSDTYIYEHFGLKQIEDHIEKELVIDWTEEEREQWCDKRILSYTKPVLNICPCNTLSHNLALDGDSQMGTCGVCYWNEAKKELEWIITLEDKQSISLAQIIEKLKALFSTRDTLKLYWTARMKAACWKGKNKQVSFNPTKSYPGYPNLEHGGRFTC